ncbi:MAG: hypothetical protein O3A02_03100 [bacterium]|nr:hypothetical protein [bacterium]
MPSSELTIGYVGAHLPSYYAREHDVFARSIEGLERLGRSLGFRLHVEPEPVVSADDAVRARQRMEAAGVDFVLLQSSSFAMGDVVREFARGRARLGLWGVPEPTREGPILLNTFVSLNINASIVSRFVKGPPVPYKWFWGDVDDRWMGPRLAVTVRALRALKRLAHARIGWVGDLAPTFFNLVFDARSVEARLGTRIHAHQLSELVDRTLAVPDAAASRAADGFLREVRASEVPAEQVERAGALSVAMRTFAADYGYDALAVSCWPQFQTDLGIAPCVAYSWLNEHDGMPVSCEGDAVGAMSMLMMNEINGDQSMLLDMNEVDEATGAIMMWHCGVAPARFADAAGVTLKHHSTLGRKSDVPPAGVVVDFVFAPQPVTITRIADDGRQLLIVEADIVAGPSRGFDGSRGWVANFRINHVPVSVADVVNTVMAEGLEHHFVVGRGHHADALSELATWAGMKPIEAVPYRDYLQLGSRMDDPER